MQMGSSSFLKNNIKAIINVLAFVLCTRCSGAVMMRSREPRLEQILSSLAISVISAGSALTEKRKKKYFIWACNNCKKMKLRLFLPWWSNKQNSHVLYISALAGVGVQVLTWAPEMASLPGQGEPAAPAQLSVAGRSAQKGRCEPGLPRLFPAVLRVLLSEESTQGRLL